MVKKRTTFHALACLAEMLSPAQLHAQLVKRGWPPRYARTAVAIGVAFADRTCREIAATTPLDDETADATVAYILSSEWFEGPYWTLGAPIEERNDDEPPVSHPVGPAGL